MMSTNNDLYKDPNLPEEMVPFNEIPACFKLPTITVLSSVVAGVPWFWYGQRRGKAVVILL